MSVNVYDFDKTVFSKDSSVKFYFFCLKKNIFLIRYIFVQLWYFVLYIFNFIGKTQFKQGFFSFLKGITDTDGYVTEFWKKNGHLVNGWYLERKRSDDIIISASPYFLIYPLCESIGITNVIASVVDKKTGVFSSENCHGKEKVNRLFSEYKYTKISEFYSDSLSDSPLAKLATKAFIVKKDSLIPWNEYTPSASSKIKSTFVSKEFFAFLIIGGINAFNGVLFASLFSLVLDANIAFIAGYIISLTISYFLNSILAFREKLHIVKYFKFCLSYVPNFLVQNVLVLLFYNLLGLNKFLVYVIAVIIAVPITFILLKLFAFKKSPTNSDSKKVRY